MLNLIALFSGLLFGAGLAISGMNDTAKVQGFLDLFGQWDMSLAFVMGGALLVALPLFRWILGRQKPVLAERFFTPSNAVIDRRLISGSVLFGCGWALIGYCPGPALAALVYGYWQTLVFVVAMFSGALIARLLLPAKPSA
jgi:uncharacterized membrane protein YedE/YeeE